MNNMMNKMEVFNNQEFGSVRAFLKEDEPWFVANDVCSILGISNSRDAMNRLDEDERRGSVIPTPSGNQNTNIINESGLYSLILRSRKKEAKKFKKWVTSEVLPSIRKKGGYMIDNPAESPDEIMARALKIADETLKRREQEIEQKDQEIAELKPKATYYDLILQCKGLLSVTQIAKDYGMSAMAMNKMLHEMDIQYKLGNQWHLYQKYADKGYTQSKTQNINHSNGELEIKTHTYWTQKGRVFLYNFLKGKGILPTIEKQELEKTKELVEV
jgi:anti-repressor protein